MSGSHYDVASLAIHNLVDIHLGESEAAADLLRNAFNLDLLADLGTRLVGDVDVDAYAGLLAEVPCRDSHAAGPVHDGGADRAVQRLARVHVVVGQGEAGMDQSLAGVGDADGRQQEIVDWAVGQPGLDEVLDVSVLGRFVGHGGLRGITG